jgi:[ribosomal protein S5]-alanine N-acetyltransferase
MATFRMPPLETQRLRIREFSREDLQAIHRLLDGALGSALTLQQRHRWLDWTVLGYEQLAELRQPPYGDRAIVSHATSELLGVCGLVPWLGPLDFTERNVPEVGMYWAVAPAHQRHGYATEAARALVDYAFSALRVHRVIATTAHENAASIGVMRKLGMQIERNPRPEPAWLQVVGVLAPVWPGEAVPRA